MLHRALFLSQRGRRPPQSLLRLLLSSSSSSSSTGAAAVAEQRPAGRGGGRHHHNHHNCRSISSTATRSQRPQGQDTQGQQSLVPPASWSIHDLRLLKEDAGGEGQQGQPAVSQEEVGTGAWMWVHALRCRTDLPFLPLCSWGGWRGTRTWRWGQGASWPGRSWRRTWAPSSAA